MVEAASLGLFECGRRVSLGCRHIQGESPGPQSGARGTLQQDWEADGLQAPRPSPGTDLQHLPNPSVLLLPKGF